MPSRADYDATLDKLAALLRKRPLTARAIAARLECSKPVAYQRLRDLPERLANGERVVEEPVRESKRGPLSVAYGIRAD